jgi:hypothetical protein
MRGAIAPHRLECDEDAPVGPAVDAVLGERGAEAVAAEPLKAGTIVGGDPDVGVEVEAVELGLARSARGGVTQVRLVAEAADTAAGTGPEGDATLDGGADEAGQDGRGFGERVGRRRGDLLWKDGGTVLFPGRSERITLTGCVFDGNGALIFDALLETWQADPTGAIPSGHDGTRPYGYGRVATDAEGR